MNDVLPEHRVTLIGGPLDGWPIVVRGRLPVELRLPYSRRMLDLAARTSEGRREWDEVNFPSEDDADGVAVYRPRGEAESARPVYEFAGSGG